MPSSSRIPSYRRHKPSGQALVTLNGRDFYLGPWDSRQSRTEYERLLGEWLANSRQLPSASKADGLTVVELLASYLTFAKDYYSEDGKPTSEYVGMRDAITPVRELYARKLVTEFGPLALKTVRQRMVNKGYARIEINRRINRIRRVFRWGVENELVPAHVLQALKAVTPLKRGRTEAPEREPIRPVPDEHVDPVLPFVASQVATMIQLQRLCGMRPTEATLIRPCDIDRTDEVWIYRVPKHKTYYRGHSREIFIGPKAQQILLPWLLRDSNAYCFSPKEADEERRTLRRQARQTPMTPSQRKRRPKKKPKRAKRDRYDCDSYRRAITYGIEIASVPHWSPNQLRHSCGTRVRSEYGLDAAQLILGHRNCQVTEIYAEADRQKAIQIAKQAG